MNDPIQIIEVADRQTIDLDQQPLIQIVETILSDHNFNRGEISIALVDDQSIRDLNRQYLNHDYETDVISFVLDLDEESGLLNGQLIVSTETAKRVATEMSLPFIHELLLYVIHGTLHLVGHDDHAEPDVQKMRDAETKYLDIILASQRFADENGEAL